MSYGIRLGAAGLNDAHVRYIAALAAGSKDGELIVLAIVQGKVVEAAGCDAAIAVKGAHIGPAQRLVAGDDGGDVVIAQNEIANDPIGLLALGELVGVVGAHFESLDGGLSGQGEEKQEKEEGSHRSPNSEFYYCGGKP